MLIVRTRREAAENGLTRYFTGKPCKYGHASERFTSSGACIECQNSALRGLYRSRAPRVLRPGTKAARFAVTIPAELTPVDFLRLSQHVATLVLRWTEDYMRQNASRLTDENAQTAAGAHDYTQRCCVLALYWADTGVTPLAAMEWQAELMRSLAIEGARSLIEKEDRVRATYLAILDKPAELCAFLSHPDSERARRDLAAWIESREPVRPCR